MACQYYCDARVSGPLIVLQDRQRAFEERLGISVAALFGVESPKVAEKTSGHAMIRPNSSLPNFTASSANGRASSYWPCSLSVELLLNASTSPRDWPWAEPDANRANPSKLKSDNLVAM